MNVVLFATNAAALTMIDHFHRSGDLVAVVSTDKLHGYSLMIEDLCKTRSVTFTRVDRRDVNTTLSDILAAFKPDVVFMAGFSYLVPQSVYRIPPMGFFNVHFSLLPAYGGPDPVFWQLKNAEQTGGVSIHRVNDGFDTGPVVMRQQLPFMPGENWGVCNNRLGCAAFNMVLQIMGQLNQTGIITTPNALPVTPSYFPKAVADDFAINWDIQTATQIESLVNACNPITDGAITMLRQQPVRILEVSPVDGTGNADVAGGTIIHAGANGLFVQCEDRKILRINIIKLNEGIITGFKLAALGVKAGDRFEGGILQHQLTEH